MNPSFAEGHFFLAKAYLDAGDRLDEAVRLARKGIELDPRGRIRAARPLRDCRRHVAAGTGALTPSWKRRADKRWSGLNPSR